MKKPLKEQLKGWKKEKQQDLRGIVVGLSASGLFDQSKIVKK